MGKCSIEGSNPWKIKCGQNPKQEYQWKCVLVPGKALRRLPRKEKEKVKCISLEQYTFAPVQYIPFDRR